MQPTAPSMSAICDCHAHIVLPHAPVERFLQMLDLHGIGRAVLVQPTHYASDCSVLATAIARAPDRLRGVGVAGAEASEADLMALHSAGVRGLRFSEMPNPHGDGRMPGTVGFDALRTLAPLIKSLGWHAQLWADADVLAAAAPWLRQLGIPIVLDHMGRPSVARGVVDRDFQI